LFFVVGGGGAVVLSPFLPWMLGRTLELQGCRTYDHEGRVIFYPDIYF
jgi:hypothetical protein